MTDQPSPESVPPKAKLLSLDVFEQGEVDILQLRKAKWNPNASEARAIDSNAKNVFRKMSRKAGPQSEDSK